MGKAVVSLPWHLDLSTNRWIWALRCISIAWAAVSSQIPQKSKVGPLRGRRAPHHPSFHDTCFLWSSDDGKRFPRELLCFITACPLRVWDEMKWRSLLSSCFIAACFPQWIVVLFWTDTEYCFSPNYFHGAIVSALWRWVMIPAIIKIFFFEGVLKIVWLLYDCSICFVSQKSAKIEKHLTG